MPEISKTANWFNQSSACLPFAVWLLWLFTQAWFCFYLFSRSWSLRLTCHQETPRDTSLWQSTTVSLSRVKARWWQGLFCLALLALVTMWRFLPWRWVSHFHSPPPPAFLIERHTQQRRVCSLPIWNYSVIFNVCWGFFVLYYKPVCSRKRHRHFFLNKGASKVTCSILVEWRGGKTDLD